MDQDFVTVRVIPGIHASRQQLIPLNLPAIPVHNTVLVDALMKEGDAAMDHVRLRTY